MLTVNGFSDFKYVEGHNLLVGHMHCLSIRLDSQYLKSTRIVSKLGSKLLQFSKVLLTFLDEIGYETKKILKVLGEKFELEITLLLRHQNIM